MSVTLRDRDGRAVLRFERRLAHPQAKVWRAVTTPAELAHWFPAAMQYEPRTGAPITFRFAEVEETSHGEVTELEPPRVFAFLWEGEQLRIELTPDGPDACLLVFTHSFDDRPGAASFATGWTACLDALQAALDGVPVHATGGWESMHDQHEAYVKLFDLDQGTSEETPDGWQVRFERQLTRPVDDIWTTLTASGAPIAGSAPPRPFTTRVFPAGAITALDAPTSLEYKWMSGERPAGRVRWQLSAGPGGAARLVLTQTGPRELADERAGALIVWQAHIEQLATQRQGVSP